MSGDLTKLRRTTERTRFRSPTGLVHDLDYGFTIGDTYLFSPNLVSSLQLGANRTNVVNNTRQLQNSWAGLGEHIDSCAARI